MAPGSSSSKVSRKRASSDQLREQANRNVRPAKGKLMNKNRLESSGSSVQRPSSPHSLVLQPITSMTTVVIIVNTSNLN